MRIADCRRLLPILLLAAGASVLPALGDESAVPMPTAELLDLSPWRGRVVLLDFWASWCVPCRRSFPWMEAMLAEHGADGLVVVAVNLDEKRDAADAFTQGRQTGFHYVYDPEGRLADAFGIDAMPSSILLDRQGRPVYRHSGFRAEDTAEYQRHIVSLLEADVEAAPAPLEIDRRRRSGVRPWQRGTLAADAMRLDADLLTLAFDDHVYFSKEASSGGRSFGGGGCGCN